MNPDPLDAMSRTVKTVAAGEVVVTQRIYNVILTIGQAGSLSVDDQW